MEIFVATVTAMLALDGRRVTITRGATMVNADDSILVGHDEMFKPLVLPYIGTKMSDEAGDEAPSSDDGDKNPQPTQESAPEPVKAPQAPKPAVAKPAAKPAAAPVRSRANGK